MPRLRRILWLALVVLSAAAAFFLWNRYVLSSDAPTLSFIREGITYELLSPRMLFVVFVLPFLVFIVGKSLADLPMPQRVLSVLLRFAFVLLIGVALSRLSRTATTQKVCTVYVVDVSESVTDEAIGDARQAIQQALDEKPKDDIVKIISFARRPRTIDLPESTGDNGKIQAPALARHDAAGAPSRLGAGSNLQAALQLSYGLFPPGYLKHVVLVSDGLQTDGDVLAEASRASQFGVKVNVAPYKRPVPGEVAVRELKLPPKVKIGESFEIHADLYASRATTCKARLYQGEALNGLEGVKELTLKAGDNDVVFKSVVRVAGEVTYAFELTDLVDDKFKENNRIAVTIDVPGRPTVLLVDGNPSQASYLSTALSAQQYDVDVRQASAFPGSLKELERYDFLILSDVSAEAFGPDAQNLVEAYLRDLGGGLLFAGGENGYALGGWMHTTMERLLPVKMDSEKKKETPSVALSLVIDRSGSMQGQPMEMAKAAARAAVDVLQPDDLVEVIAFDSAATRYVKMTQARRKSRIDGDIARIQPGGGTEIFPALDAAFQDLSVTQARKKHVILLTDGKAPTGGIRDVVQAMAAESITVTTVGLGNDLDDALLTMIKDVGGGRYHKVPDPNALPKIFTTETEVVSRQAAQEDWFPVTQVGPAGFLSGIDISQAPYLHGYVSTQMKPAPAQEILRSDRGEPILARWRVGIGQSLAWTSDVKNRWAVEWLRWPGFGQFFGQLVRENMRTKHRRELDMKTEVVAGEVRATIDAFGADERFENGLDSTLTVVGPMPSTDKREVPMKQTAPGRYEAAFLLDKYGSFLLRAEHKRPGEDGKKNAVAVSYGHISNPYPVEFSRFEPDKTTLAQVATATGGLVDPTPAQAFAPGEDKITYHEALWPRVIMAAIAVFLLDLFVRRVRIFDRKVVATRSLPQKRTKAALSGIVARRTSGRHRCCDGVGGARFSGKCSTSGPVPGCATGPSHDISIRNPSLMPSSPRRPRSPHADLRAAFVVTVSALAATALAAPGCGGETSDTSSQVAGSGGSSAGGSSAGGSSAGGSGGSGTCPASGVILGEACTTDGALCPAATDDGCNPELRCSGGKWLPSSSCNPPPPAVECPQTMPKPGDPCTASGVGNSCTYDIEGCVSSVSFACIGNEWKSSSEGCPVCPDTPPKSGEACPGHGLLCEYELSADCVRATCVDGAWSATTIACMPAGTGGSGGGGSAGSGGGGAGGSAGTGSGGTGQGGENQGGAAGNGAGGAGQSGAAGAAGTGSGTANCRMFLDSATCAEAEGCRWLEPGCSEPPLPQAGCFPTQPCDAAHACDAGTTCQTVVYDPCAGAACDACGAEVAVCL